jgi:hypothetical protein
MNLPGETEAGSAGRQPCRGITGRAHRADVQQRGSQSRSVQKLYPTPAWNGIALELLGANREKYAKRCLSITRKVTEATSED